MGRGWGLGVKDVPCGEVRTAGILILVLGALWVRGGWVD